MTGRQPNVVWQAWQLSLDWMCVALLPVSRTPSWQLTQVAVTPSCVNRAGVQAVVVWQVPQALSLGM